MTAARRLAVLALTALLATSACSSDEDGARIPTTETTASTNETGAPTTEPTPVLEILVTNDDGYQAEGIDVLTTALDELDDVEVTVVAPLEQRSGTGGTSTDGEVAVTDVELASGFPARAVDGFPADSVRVAIDELGLEPDLVVAGINEGQNVGPSVDLSGTVGAARAAVERGVPALAVSQGTDTYDYEAAVPFVLEWVGDHRAALTDGSAELGVTNLNVPSCPVGEVRGLASVEVDPDSDLATALSLQDCASTTPLDQLDGDVATLVAGYATISPVPDEPATPPEVVTTTTGATTDTSTATTTLATTTTAATG